MASRILSVNIEVPDNKWVIVAARHVPHDWPVLDSQRLGAFAAVRPEWDYMVAGEQLSRTIRPGATLMRRATVNRWGL